MKLGKKILLTVIALILTAVIGWLVYYLVHFYFYNEYKNYLSSYEVETGTEFKAATDSSADVEGMVLVSENDNFKLYTDIKTAYIAIYDKRNGETTYSNPIDLEEDTVASSTNLDYLRSQLLVEYYNDSRTAGTYDTYSMSVEREQFSCESIENGIRYNYELGDKTSETGIVPIYISAERLTSVLEAMSEEGAKYTKSRYIESTVGEGFMELTEAASKGASTIRKLNKYFEEAGFTEAEYVEQMTASGVTGAVPISFKISLEYRLEEDGLLVSVPIDQVVEEGGGKIYRVQVLNYFGAAGTDETGYMVVPNGSGSLINFNNNKETVESYSQYVYGIDPLAAEYTVLENTEKARLALFGICREKSSILATIEDGASLSYITAGVSGKLNSYNYAYTTFVLRGYDKLSMFGTTGNEADIPIVEEDIYNVNLSVKYSFLTEENKGYAGIANYYRQRLIEEGKLTLKEETAGDISLYYDVLGGVKQTGYFLGTQYLKIFPMTTFDEAGKIFDELKEAGISKQVMNFQGWFNGGYYHDVPDKIKVIGKLGGKSGLEELSSKLSDAGSRFYADVVFQQVSFISKRYQYSFETSRYYGAGYVAYFGQINPTTLRQTSSLTYMETMYDLVSPKFLTRYVDTFVKKIQNYDIYGIALRDLGDDLHSDKKRTEVINREEALDIVLGELANLESTGKEIMVSGGNDYAFAYSTDILNVPTSDNDYFIIDEEIPLYEMIIHGSIDYSGDLINLSDTYDITDVELKLIEYGAAPHFVFTWENSTEMKYTGLSRFYSTTFSKWKDDAVNVYNVVNDALKQVSGASMINHEILADGIKKITYSNGVVIYINNTTADYVADDITIPARSYEVEGN